MFSIGNTSYIKLLRINSNLISLKKWQPSSLEAVMGMWVFKKKKLIKSVEHERGKSEHRVMNLDVSCKVEWSSVMKCCVCLYVSQKVCLCVHLVFPEGRTAVSAAVQTACTSGLSQPILFTWTHLKNKLNDAACKGGRRKKHEGVCEKRRDGSHTE